MSPIIIKLDFSDAQWGDDPRKGFVSNRPPPKALAKIAVHLEWGFARARAHGTFQVDAGDVPEPIELAHAIAPAFVRPQTGSGDDGIRVGGRDFHDALQVKSKAVRVAFHEAVLGAQVAFDKFLSILRRV